MPSSLDHLARPWQPSELGPDGAIVTTAPGVARRTDCATPFEVSPAVGVPDAVLEPARLAARSAGYAAGWAHGVAAARVITDAETHAARAREEQHAVAARAAAEQALAALQAASNQFRTRSVPALADLEDLIVSSAFTLAEAVIGAGLRDDPERGAKAVARVLALVPEGDDVTIRLHPRDHETLVASDARLGPHVRLVPDPSLAPGDGVATSGATIVDARIADGLDRVREVLAPSEARAGQ